MPVDQSSPGNEMEIDIDSSSKPKCQCPDMSPIEECPNPIEFEASGIGGVLLQDNFAIRVKSRRRIIDDACSSATSKDHAHQHRPIGIPPRLRTILASPRTRGTSASAKNTSLVEEQILSSRRKDLPPSALPPASFFPFVSPDDDDDDDEGEASEELLGDESDVENSESSDASVHHLLACRHRPLPAAAPQLMTWPAEYDSGSESEEEDNSEEGDDDNDDNEDEEKRFKACRDKSVDLLRRATATDPSGIPMGEREHDTNVADKLAEEIPAGSSAATAGGGSGFSSPNIERDRSEEDGIDGGRSGEGVVGKRMSLKRTRTSESVVGRVNKSPRWSLNN